MLQFVLIHIGARSKLFSAYREILGFSPFLDPVDRAADLKRKRERNTFIGRDTPILWVGAVRKQTMEINPMRGKDESEQRATA